MSPASLSQVHHTPYSNPRNMQQKFGSGFPKSVGKGENLDSLNPLTTDPEEGI